MQTTRLLYRPAPSNAKTFRQDTNFAAMSNESLKFALDLLNLHGADDDLAGALFECAQRIERGTWLDINKAPPAQNNLPAWVKIFPFNLLWRQRP